MWQNDGPVLNTRSRAPEASQQNKDVEQWDGQIQELECMDITMHVNSIDKHSSAYLGMATVRSVTVKKVSPKEALITQQWSKQNQKTDSMAEFSYLCSLCKCILKYVVHSEQKLCTFE